MAYICRPRLCSLRLDGITQERSLCADPTPQQDYQYPTAASVAARSSRSLLLLRVCAILNLARCSSDKTRPLRCALHSALSSGLGSHPVRLGCRSALWRILSMVSGDLVLEAAPILALVSALAFMPKWAWRIFSRVASLVLCPVSRAMRRVLSSSDVFLPRPGALASIAILYAGLAVSKCHCSRACNRSSESARSMMTQSNVSFPYLFQACWRWRL